jgi:thiol-disulfide isomerase/thioredoxin
MNKTMLTVGGLLVVGALGFVVYSSQMEMKEMDKMKSEKTAMEMKEKEAMMMKDHSGTSTPEQMEAMKKDGSMKGGDTMMKKSVGMYAAYSADKLALAKDNKVVIFFHAPWCPTCRALDAEITSKGVKDGYVILKADYDTSKDLKAKYGVTSQHTLVQVDASGMPISKWSGGDLANIYAKAK